MKRMDLLCSSPSSTATCSSLSHGSVIRNTHRTVVEHHHRNPFLNDRGLKKTHLLDIVPCSSSEFPFNPKAHYQYEKMTTRKKKTNSVEKTDFRRKSSADVSDLKGSFGTSNTNSFTIDRNSTKDMKKLSSWKNDDYGVVKLTSSSSSKARSRSIDESAAMKSSCLTGQSHEQSLNEVVLYVSLHCRGCEEKVRKHISKMEGVKSYTTDLGTKKVTIIGNVSPLNVLASISRVKRAQLWPSLPPSTSPMPFSQW